MRLMAGLVLVLSLAIPREHLSGQERVFEFAGWRLGDTISKAQLRRCGSPDASGTVSCVGPPQDVAGIFVVPVRSYHGARLYNLTLTFATEAYSELLRGFTLVYGPPDSTATAEYQTVVGGTLRGRVATWAFPGGPLVVQEIDVSARMGTASITDTTISRRIDEGRDAGLKRALSPNTRPR